MSDTQKHKKLNVPNLRFPGFEGEWGKSYLGEISEYRKERISTSQLTVNTFVSTENMLPDYGAITAASSVPSSNTVSAFCAGDILLSNIRPYLKKVWQANSCGGCSNDVLVIQPKRVYDKFLYYIIANDSFINYAMSGAKGVKMPRGDKDQLMKYELALPNLTEQEKIASFLYLLDQRIAIQNKVIEKYESLIKAIILRSQFSASNRKVYLREILTERKELNEKGYDICSVSVSKGVVNQVEYLGRSFAAKETAHYHVVRKGDIVYTKSPTGDFPYGIIKQSYLEAPVAVSPLYGVYEPIDYQTGVYLHHFFCSPHNAKNYLHKLIQKGAKNTINITNQHFLDNLICIPERNTLRGIVSAIETLSKRVVLEKELLSIYAKQKTFLLSSLFI